MKTTCACVASILLALPSLSAGQHLGDRIADNHHAYVPSGEGPFPAIVVIPGCSGISSDDIAAEEANPALHEDDLLFRQHYRGMAENLSAEGHVVLLVDIHSAEGVLTACNGEIGNERIAEYIDEAIAFAKNLPGVDPNNISLIGWSMGGGGVLKWLHGPRNEDASVRSAIAVYPSCSKLRDLTISIPVLMLLGGADDIADPSKCEDLVRRATIRADVAVVNYPGARHGFDIANAPPVLDIGNGMTVGYQQVAADASWHAIQHFLGSAFSHASEAADSEAQYLANTGVMISRGETRILFDPLFRNTYGVYDAVPADVEAALFAGTAPFDGIDAVFISHHHEDHFEPALILRLLEQQTTIELYAPEQAAQAVRRLVRDSSDPVLQRVHGLDLENGDDPEELVVGALLIEAVRIPHTGWPEYHPNVENIVFRVTLDDSITVMHLGDADTDDAHFAKHPEHWQKRHTHFAMPPYWFFQSERGRAILDNRIDATHTIGVHVSNDVPDAPEQRSEGLRDADLFTQPGERRRISGAME